MTDTVLNLLTPSQLRKYCRWCQTSLDNIENMGVPGRARDKARATLEDSYDRANLAKCGDLEALVVVSKEYATLLESPFAHELLNA